jgi:hypothetical protein
VLHYQAILGRKGMPGTNTLAYYEHLSIIAVTSIITLGPGSIDIKLFF